MTPHTLVIYNQKYINRVNWFYFSHFTEETAETIISAYSTTHYSSHLAAHRTLYRSLF